ncbi:MAG: histidine phosphatase family protein [Caldilineaceae bacterium]|nr:histidine phosphatase family protein [Caldilineaceae bacterium]
MTVKIYLARHATPDWSRTDIRYDIPPGPPLTAQGEDEARKLGEFLRTKKISHVYASPLERTQRTAALAAAVLGLPVVTEELIAEWRRGENETDVAGRFNGFWERICRQSETEGPVLLVTHGGPIKVMLLNLGMPRAMVDEYCRKFDRGNPVPPAGVWLAANSTNETPWHLALVFNPNEPDSTPESNRDNGESTPSGVPVDASGTTVYV